MSSEFGKRIRVSLFGQSHSKAIGAVIDGIPAGESIDISQVKAFMARRAPGQNEYSSARCEPDEPHILSGIVDGITCGSPIGMLIDNQDVQSRSYEPLRDIPRPSHADYPALVKYGPAHDIRGGGHFSARLTAPLCFAGAICRQILARQGITAAAHIASIGLVDDDPLDPVTAEALSAVPQKSFPVLNDEQGQKMREQIAAVKAQGDSIGGVVECCILGVPVGVGEPIFDGIENRIAQAVFGIPAVKGIEFGAGFAAGRMRGSAYNDPYEMAETIRTRTNHSGGILGGLANGMPIVFRVAFKPTPSIALPQQSVSLERGENTTLEIHGRHDPCVVPRAVVCVEAAALIAMLDLVT